VYQVCILQKGAGMSEKINNEHSLLHHLSHIVPNMLQLKHQGHLPEFVLHELCGNRCFKLEKAAYFVDNPDFDCLKGVAGYFRDEEYPDNDSIWEKPEEFSTHMSKALFNQQIKSFNRGSVRKDKVDDAVLVKEMAHQFSFKNYNFYSWDMKNDNHGIFLFELPQDPSLVDGYLKNGATILSFCPLF